MDDPHGGNGDGTVDLTAVVRGSALPVALVDLDTLRFVAMSPAGAELLGLAPDDVEIDALSVTDDTGGNRGDALRLVASGRLGGYEARRRLRRADDGTTVERTIWVRALPPEGGRRLAVVVAGETRDDGPIDLPGTDIDDSVVRRAAPVAVGTVDAEWRIARISADVEPILGRKPEDCVGLPVLAAVHPADVAGLLAVVDQASNTRRAVMIRLRVLDGSQRWVPVDVVLTPLEGGAHVPRFGFALAAAASSMSRPGTEERIAALEQTLWRIAQELQSAGVVQGLERMPDVLALPALRDLTARQWEILTRLLRGERVPGIARAMYLSPSTIRNHLSAIFRKVGVHSQEQLLEVLKAEADGSVATAGAEAGAGAGAR